VQPWEAETPATILIIEDEQALADILAENLQAEGYTALRAADGAEGGELWQHRLPELVVLDVMLPKRDGYALCRAMRAAGDATPVLFLSAKGQPSERVEGLAAGGDDYLAKPFHLPELLLRIRNLLRRQNHPQDASFSFAGHRVDFRSWTAKLADGREEPLGERELGIFRLLARRAGEVVSRDDILDAVWGNDVFPSSRTVDNFVVRLRKLFEPDPSSPIYFHTVWGVGYKFTPGDGDKRFRH
jgi:two-component system alkaline phosphatase synthesis response regulator PhoP